MLDSSNKYICNRIVSRSDDKNVNSKSLQKIFLNDSSMAVIIDDREDVWKGSQSEQLLLVRPYIYFHNLPQANNSAGMGPALPSNLSSPSPVISLNDPPGRLLKMLPQLSAEYSEADDQLLRCLALLRQLHAAYFAPPSLPRSVGTLLSSMRMDVLRSCTLTFSGIIPTNETAPQAHFLYKLALSLGAQVSLALTSSTTHLLCVSLLTHKVQTVLSGRGPRPRAAVHVLHPDWLIYCKWCLARVSEETFLLTPPASPPSASANGNGSGSVGSSSGTTQGVPAGATGSGGGGHTGHDRDDKKRKLQEAIKPAAAEKRPRLSASAPAASNEGPAEGTAEAGAADAADSEAEAEEDDGEAVLPLRPTLVPDMDTTISTEGDGEGEGATEVEAAPLNYLDLDLEAEGNGEGDSIPGPPEEEEEQQAEAEDNGDCRAYFDQHMVDRYDDSDDLGDGNGDSEDDCLFQERVLRIDGDMGDDEDDEEEGFKDLRALGGRGITPSCSMGNVSCGSNSSNSSREED